MNTASAPRNAVVKRLIPLMTLGVFCLVFGLAALPAYAADDFTVTLLGTGCPVPSPDRFGYSTLTEAGDSGSSSIWGEG